MYIHIYVCICMYIHIYTYTQTDMWVYKSYHCHYYVALRCPGCPEDGRIFEAMSAMGFIPSCW